MRKVESTNIQCQDKIYKIFKPATFEGLRNEFKKRVSFFDHRFSIVYEDCDMEEVIVETPDDYLISTAQNPPVGRYFLKLNQESKASVLSKILNQCFKEIIDKLLGSGALGDIRVFSNGERGFFNELGNFNKSTCDNFLQQANDYLDNNKVSDRFSNNFVWVKILDLIEAKVKQVAASVLHKANCQAQLESQNKKENFFENNSTRNQLENKHKEEFFGVHRRMALSSLPEIKARSQKKLLLSDIHPGANVLSKIFNDSLSSNLKKSLKPFLFTNVGGFEDAKPSFCSNSAHTRVNLSRYYESLFITPNEPCTVIELPHYLPRSEARFAGRNKIEVKLLVENETKQNWPENVQIVGRSDCLLTRIAHYPLRSALAAMTRMAIKFSFNFNEADIPDENSILLGFCFLAIDPVCKIKYAGDFSVALNGKRQKLSMI